MLAGDFGIVPAVQATVFDSNSLRIYDIGTLVAEK